MFYRYLICILLLILVLIIAFLVIRLKFLPTPIKIHGGEEINLNQHDYTINQLTDKVLAKYADDLNDEVLEGSKIYKNIKNPKFKIKSIKSNKIIQTILRYGNPKDYYRMLLLFSKHMNFRNIKKRMMVEKFLKNKFLNDSDFFKFVKKEIYEPKESKEIIEHKYMNQAHKYYGKIKNIILKNNPKFRINNILDIGCGPCKFIKYLGNKIGLMSKNIHGTDIKEWVTEYEERGNLEIEFKYMSDDTLPYENETFEIITCMMVLHHVNKLDILLSEINRCLKPGGFLIIREHDAMTAFDHMLADIEHELYALLYHNMSYEDFKKKYYAKYHDFMEWDILLNGYSFHRIYMEYDTTGVINEISPTRYYLAIYKKT